MPMPETFCAISSPRTAIIARRPFFSSFSCFSLKTTGSSGLKPRKVGISPGTLV